MITVFSFYSWYSSQIDEEKTKREDESKSSDAVDSASASKGKKKAELQIKTSVSSKGAKKKETIEGVLFITAFSNPNPAALYAFFMNELGFVSID